MGLLQTIVQSIKVSAPEKPRSPKWAKVRAAFLSTHKSCAACGSTKTLEVHHITPFSNKPELELDPNNLIVLCESATDGVICHLYHGHSGSYQSYNPHVVEDAARSMERITNRLT